MLSRRPLAPLDRWIATVWTSARRQGLPHTREWGLPTGRADLVVPLDRPALRRHSGLADWIGHALSGGLLQGAQEQPILRDTSGASIVVGAQFRAGGLAGLFDLPAQAVVGLTLPLEDLWPGFAEALQHQVHQRGRLLDEAGRLSCFEQALMARLRPQAEPDAMVEWASTRLAEGSRVSDVQRASGIGVARFIERYRSACGLAPKRHAALMRFQTSLQLAQGTCSWAQVAADAGYADQAHLTREYTRLAGVSPARSRLQATAFTNHLICT